MKKHLHSNVKNCRKVDQKLSFHRIILSVLCKFLPISVCFVAVWTRKIWFRYKSNIQISRHSLGRINSIIFISHCIGMYFTHTISFSRCHTHHRRKLRAEKVSVVAEKVSPQSPTRNQTQNYGMNRRRNKEID